MTAVDAGELLTAYDDLANRMSLGVFRDSTVGDDTKSILKGSYLVRAGKMPFAKMGDDIVIRGYLEVVFLEMQGVLKCRAQCPTTRPLEDMLNMLIKTREDVNTTSERFFKIAGIAIGEFEKVFPP